MWRVLARQSQTQGTYHYLSDALGSTTRLSDNNGATIVNYSYDPYGATQADAQADNPFQYTGRENDGTGLYYYRARYYSPAYQRFISEDPIGLDGGINVYAYVEGNPVSYTDPLGLWAWGDPLPQWMVDGAAGMGDVFLLGQGQRLRDLLGIDGGIDRCSLAYGVGKATGIGVLIIAPLSATAASSAGMVRVTSWASEGVKADLAAGRWVMTGGANLWNYLRTGLWGPVVNNGRFSWTGASFRNSITREVPSASVGWPSGWNMWRGIFGQRIIRP